MNIFPALAAALIGAAIGIHNSYMLKKRMECLSEFLSMISDIQTEIRFKHSTLPLIIRELGERRYTFLKDISNEQGGELSSVWKKKTQTLSTLRTEDKNVIVAIGNALGGSDVEGQLAMLETNKRFLQGNLDMAAEEYTKKGKLYRTIGVLCGAAFGVILL